MRTNHPMSLYAEISISFVDVVESFERPLSAAASVGDGAYPYPPRTWALENAGVFERDCPDMSMERTSVVLVAARLVCATEEEGKDQAEIVAWLPEPSVSQELCEPMRGTWGVARKGSGSSCRESDAGDEGRYGAGRGGTGGTGELRPLGETGPNQKDDFAGSEGFDPVMV